MNTREFLRRYAYVYCYAISLFLVAAALYRHGVQTVSSQQTVENMLALQEADVSGLGNGKVTYPEIRALLQL